MSCAAACAGAVARPERGGAAPRRRLGYWGNCWHRSCATRAQTA